MALAAKIVNERKPFLCDPYQVLKIVFLFSQGVLETVRL